MTEKTAWKESIAVGRLWEIFMDYQGVYKKCYVFGTGQFAYQCAMLLQECYRLDGVFEYGAYVQSGLSELCAKSQIAYQCLKQKAEADHILSLICERDERILILSASNTYIFPKEICEAPNINIMNYHPAFMSAHIGRNAEAWAIFSRDQYAGVTWHKVTADIDRGGILIEDKILLDEKITSLKLMLLQYKSGVECLKKILPDILCKEEKMFLDNYTCGVMHYSYEKPNNGVLDFNWDENQISAFLRAMDYGKLSVLGSPVVMENGKRYRWSGYKIANKDDSFIGGEKDKVIIKENLVFLLKDYQLS